MRTAFGFVPGSKPFTCEAVGKRGKIGMFRASKLTALHPKPPGSNIRKRKHNEGGQSCEALGKRPTGYRMVQNLSFQFFEAIPNPRRSTTLLRNKCTALT